MKTRIRTFEDLEAEKLRLQTVLAYQGSLIKSDVNVLREELRPIKSVLGFAGKFISKDKKNPLLNAGVDIAGDIILKNLIFARSGFLTKWILPYLIKNFSANFLSDNKTGLVDKISDKITALIGGLLKRK